MPICRFISFVIFISILASCGDSDPKTDGRSPSLLSPKPTLRVKLLNQGQVFYGDTIRMEIEAKDPQHVFTKVSISLSDGNAVLASSPSGKFVLPTQVTGGGALKLKIDASFEDGQKAVRYKDIAVLAKDAPQLWSFKVEKRYPHDPTSFTQGFLIHNGFLYEGTGNYKESRIRKIELATGKVLQEKAMDDDMFGEGITIFNNKVYQLSYKTSRGFVYDLESFDLLDEFTYNTYTTEGWGLTHNDTALIASDGSAILYFLDPNTLKETGRMRVFNHRNEVTRLNELEYHKGLIYANIYTSAEIVAIDATTGQVVHEYTARGMITKSELTADMDVLNGIAIQPLNGNLLITGKYWRTIYEVSPIPRLDL